MADAEPVPVDESTPDQPGSGQPDCPPPPETNGCEPGVDELNCIAEGDAAKSAYHAGFKADLATAKTNYESARQAYAEARRKAAPVVQDLENQITHLLERIRCQIEQKRVWRCLDDAWCEVQRELRCCPEPAGCCATTCEFPTDGLEGKTSAELAVLIADYQARIEEARQCFTKLLGETDRLNAAVDEAKAAVAKLNTDLSGDQATLDLKKCYAEGLVTEWKIGAIWAGFDHVQAYVDCICQALTCWTKGCSAVYVLKGAEAVAKCKDQAKLDRCTKLRTETAAQIQAAYERLCPKPSCDDDGPSEPSEPSDDDDDDDDDCGCHHHHRRHHHKHHHHKHHHHDCDCDDEPPRTPDCGCH
jgi:hypothetical protein